MTRPVLLGFSLLALAASAGPAAAQTGLWASSIGTFAQNRSNASGTPERVSGPLAGVQAGATLSRLWEVDVMVLGGDLDPRGTAGDERRLAEARAELGVVALPWMAFRFGGFARSFSTPIGRERWTGLRAGSEIRSLFITGPLRAVLRGTVMPLVSVTGEKRPTFALSAETGLEWQGSRFTASLLYGRERYVFPPVAGVKRIEDLSTISARLGFRVGGPR